VPDHLDPPAQPARLPTTRRTDRMCVDIDQRDLACPRDDPRQG
jgi:hypothetical protein